MAPSTSTCKTVSCLTRAATLAVVLFAGDVMAKKPRTDLRIRTPVPKVEDVLGFSLTSVKDEVADEVPPVLALNQHTFGGNVLSSQHVTNWVVLFCPSWWEPCQNIDPHFTEHARNFQDALNKELLSSEVRFAKVDCATDKVLCNEQDVDTYPVVNHYVGGERVTKWSGGQKNDVDRLQKWVGKRFEATSSSTASAPATSLREVLGSYLVPGSRLIDILLAVLGLAASFRLVLSNPELLEKGGPRTAAGARGNVAPAGAVGPSAESATSAEGGARMRRLLPEEWRASRSSLEL